MSCRSRATGGQHAAAHTTAHSGADAHGSRGLALGGGSRADRRRAAAAHARTRASGRTPVRLCLLRHRLQPPSCPPRPELEAKPPQLAVDLLPVRRRATPRVHPGEPVADVVPRAARHAGVTVVEEEASRRHPVPPLRARQLSPRLATLRQLLSALLRAAGAPEEHVEYALAQERLKASLD